MDPNWKTKAFFKGLKPASQQKLTFLKDLGFCILAQELHTSLKYKGGCNFYIFQGNEQNVFGELCVLHCVRAYTGSCFGNLMWLDPVQFFSKHCSCLSGLVSLARF